MCLHDAGELLEENSFHFTATLVQRLHHIHETIKYQQCQRRTSAM